MGRLSLLQKAIRRYCWQAKRLGILNGLNPIQDVSIPRAPEPEETYAYSLDEVKAVLGVLPEPAWTVVLCAALTGLRKGEIRGLEWEDFSGEELRNGTNRKHDGAKHLSQ
jgi:integrase